MIFLDRTTQYREDFEVEVEFQTLDVWESPEAVEYARKIKEKVRDRWDAMLVPKQNPLKFPIGVWFPATVSDEIETPAVYQIDHWIGDTTATVLLNCSDSAEVRTGTKIIRRYKDISVNIGTVRRVRF